MTSTAINFVTDTCAESVAVMRKLSGPRPPVGVPEYTPVSSSSVRPGSRLPDVNLYGGVPPEAVIVVLYGMFCGAFGNMPGAVISTLETLIDNQPKPMSLESARRKLTL